MTNAKRETMNKMTNEKREAMDKMGNMDKLQNVYRKIYPDCDPSTDELAVAYGLTLALTAPTDSKSSECIAMVEKWAAVLDHAEIERAKEVSTIMRDGIMLENGMVEIEEEE